MPEDLARQIEPILRMVHALGLKLEVSEGCEADDCIASLAARFSSERPVVIVSGDKDLKQCLGPNVYMWDPAAREEKLLNEAEFRAESGVSPAQWPDVQALVGDASDNIPGVPGIGPKTARQIFEICPSLEDIRDHFVLLPPKIQDKMARPSGGYVRLAGADHLVAQGLRKPDPGRHGRAAAECAGMPGSGRGIRTLCPAPGNGLAAAPPER